MFFKVFFGLQIEDLLDHNAIAGIKEMGNFSTDWGVMPVFIVPMGKAVPSRKLGLPDGLLRGLGKSKPASRIASVRGDDEVSGFE